MPERSAICEAERRVVDLDVSRPHQILDRLVYRLLVPSLDELVGQLTPAVVQLRTSLFRSVRLNSFFKLENVKAVSGLDDSAHVAGMKHRYGLLENIGQLALF